MLAGAPLQPKGNPACALGPQNIKYIAVLAAAGHRPVLWEGKKEPGVSRGCNTSEGNLGLSGKELIYHNMPSILEGKKEGAFSQELKGPIRRWEAFFTDSDFIFWAASLGGCPSKGNVLLQGKDPILQQHLVFQSFLILPKTG